MVASSRAGRVPTAFKEAVDEEKEEEAVAEGHTVWENHPRSDWAKNANY